jgi:hypothetical protein
MQSPGWLSFPSPLSFEMALLWSLQRESGLVWYVAASLSFHSLTLQWLLITCCIFSFFFLSSKVICKKISPKFCMKLVNHTVQGAYLIPPSSPLLGHLCAKPHCRLGITAFLGPPHGKAICFTFAWHLPYYDHLHSAGSNLLQCTPLYISCNTKHNLLYIKEANNMD